MLERTKKFYNDLFGWKMEKMPGQMEYWTFLPLATKMVVGSRGSVAG
jgi:predicted enzyme related to lactoylglutathione lyase